ncbi:HD domain-containing protein [Paraflavisolibacter sp. H34]|uniref:CCA tRNA nucleotidyltransferase n=1 Tax=Huijunlia imazamoxiresistens TaxID=3127457 RepID=UPI003016A97D
MDIHLSEREEKVFETVAAAAEQLQTPCYLIGGFVRDKIMGRPTKDADIVCVGDGLELAKCAANRFHPHPKVSYFKNFGTAYFKLSDGFDVEFVGARRESYRYHSRNPEVEPGTLADDQNRRDFTINALAISLNPQDFGKLLDPFGGLQDIDKKIIRTPTDANQTFCDDPLRMMRAVRFATQLHFHIEEQTFEAICKNAARIEIISQERITDELNKIMLSEKPSIGFSLLFHSGLLHYIFPQLVDLAGAEYIEGKGHKDNFFHTLEVLDHTAARSGDLWLRWAALLHDIGKPATKRFEEPHGWTFHGHEVVGGRMVPKIFNQLKLPMGDNMKYVRKLVEMHLRPISLSQENITDSAIRRLLFDAGTDFDDLILLCESDITTKNRKKAKRYFENFELVRQRCHELEESDRIRNWQPPITGELIMETFGIGPCREVGFIKNAIKEGILDGLIPNNYEAAFQFMLDKGREFKLEPKTAQ